MGIKENNYLETIFLQLIEQFKSTANQQQKNQIATEINFLTNGMMQLLLMRVNLFSYEKSENIDQVVVIDQQDQRHQISLSFITCDCDEFLNGILNFNDLVVVSQKV